MVNGITSGVCRYRKSVVSQMTDPHGAERLEAWMQEQYGSQMEHWLEFAWKNHRLDKYRTQQTSRYDRHTFTRRASKNYVGSPRCGGTPKSRDWKVGRGEFTKSSEKSWFNNYDLFQDWKSEWRSQNEGSRNFVHYTDAIPELNLLLDYMSDHLPDPDQVGTRLH